MARPRSVNITLPPGMICVKKPKAHYYYYDQGASSKPRYKSLGTEYTEAIRQWGELEGGRAKENVKSIYMFEDMATKFQSKVIPTKEPSTQSEYLGCLKKLREFFDDAKLTNIKPIHVSQYREWRSDTTIDKDGKLHKGAPVRANRELATLSTMWNHAREWGMTDLANPCAGIKRNQEAGRDTYITDAQVDEVLKFSEPTLSLAIELAYLTGQRPADVLKMRETDIREGCLEIRQGKTKTPIRINIAGRLAVLIDQCRAAKASSKVFNTALIVGLHGKPIGVQWLSILWKRARIAAGITEDIQFRDLRAKAVSDKEESSGNIRDAQQLAGHSTVAMTEHYSRKRRGKKIDATR